MFSSLGAHVLRFKLHFLEKNGAYVKKLRFMSMVSLTPWFSISSMASTMSSHDNIDIEEIHKTPILQKVEHKMTPFLDP